MKWLSRLFGSEEKRIAELEKRVEVLEHNMIRIIHAVKNTNGALEKVGDFLGVVEREIVTKKSGDSRIPGSSPSKKEYIN